MSILKWQMDVYNRLRENLPQTRVFLEGVPESTTVPQDPTGMIRPMLILWFGQISPEQTDTGAGVSDLCGLEEGCETPGQMNFAVESVAPSGLALLQLENAVRRLLTGFAPDGKGQLTEGGMATIRDPLPVGISAGLRYYKPLFFSGRV